MQRAHHRREVHPSHPYSPDWSHTPKIQEYTSLHRSRTGPRNMCDSLLQRFRHISMYSSTESTQWVKNKLTSMSLHETCWYDCVQLTAEERVLIAVVSTVVVAVTQGLRVDANVGVVTLDLAIRTRLVSCNGKRPKHQAQGQKHRTSGGPANWNV